MKINLHKFYKPIGEILWASFYLQELFLYNIVDKVKDKN